MTVHIRGGAPHAVDLHVGRRVRALRRFARLSLSDLAQQIGVVYQQLQKYETGANRMSASTLYEICQVLRVPIACLYEGLPEPLAPTPRSDVLAQLDAVFASPSGCDLVAALLRMPVALRGQYAALATGIADHAAPSTDSSAADFAPDPPRPAATAPAQPASVLWSAG